MKHNILKKVLMINLLCILLFCGACSKQKNETQEETWNKHAFLLEKDDVFFVSMPESWRSNLNDNRSERVAIYVPDKEITDDKWEAFSSFRVGIPYELSQPGESFIFADGQIGKKYIIDDIEQAGKKYVVDYAEPTGKKYIVDDTAGHTEYILSEDEKYMFDTSRYRALDDEQYENFLEYSKQFYGSMIFQKGQIGLPQEKKLKEREKVNLHIRHIGGYLYLDVTVPEGLFFEVKEKSLDYSLILFLDETKKNYVEIYRDVYSDFYRGLERSEGVERLLTDQTYKEKAIYVSYIRKNYAVYPAKKYKRINVYNFLSWTCVSARLSVPEEDKEMFEAATDIIRSIKLH